MSAVAAEPLRLDRPRTRADVEMTAAPCAVEEPGSRDHPATAEECADGRWDVSRAAIRDCRREVDPRGDEPTSGTVLLEGKPLGHAAPVSVGHRPMLRKQLLEGSQHLAA